jgi:predicted small secreted protein
MKTLILLFSFTVAGCNTTAGILSGAGKDLQAAGSWVSSQEQVPLK